MKLDAELALAAQNKNSWLTIGVFDGVHRGHQHLFGQLIAAAAASGSRAGVVTFRNHPASVLRPDFQPRYLSSVEERISRISDAGIDFVVPVTFDEDLSELSARDFIARLQGTLRMRGLVVGPDFALGHRREADVNILAALGKALGFDVHVVDSLEESGTPVKSTAVRQALARGDVPLASRLLARNFTLTGVVIGGDKRGRTLGFPTANLQPTQGMAIPADGIYATWALIEKKRVMAATSIGIRPTFGVNDRVIEAFLLDFQGDLYDRSVGLEFVERLRDELKFDSIEKLTTQMDADVAQTREILEASEMAAS